MLDVEIKTTEARTVGFIPMLGAYSQIPEAMGRLYGWIAQHGLQPAGMPSGVYLDDPETVPESEAAWEVRAPLASGAEEVSPDESGVGVKHVPAQLVAFGRFRGPYEEVGPAYGELAAWIAANGYRVVGPPEEHYFSDPSTPPQDTVTEISFPVMRV
jgi:effector-binding domain-containing protein